MIMPSLLLQKPSKNSKTKDLTKVIEWRLQLRTDEHLAELLKEGATIQSNLEQVLIYLKSWQSFRKSSWDRCKRAVLIV